MNKTIPIKSMLILYLNCFLVSCQTVFAKFDFLQYFDKIIFDKNEVIE